MTTNLVKRAEEHDYAGLFIRELRWSAPDHRPIVIATDDGGSLTATNVSSYKGLRVWVCASLPGSELEAALDREIAKTSTDRLVIFFDEGEQIWRWPVRRSGERSTTTRLTRHRHRTGAADPKFEARLRAIQLPLDLALDANAVLAKVRSAFDVETQNETKRASQLMARMYAALEKSYPASYDAERRDHEISATLARLLFLMFGDDTDMWRVDLFRDFVHRHSKADGPDIGSRFNRLFAYLDTPPHERDEPDEDLSQFPYVNGGIFEERVTLPDVNVEFVSALLDACAVDWSTISPAIFGSMFQSVRDARTRRELGEHYTSEHNILKTLNPLFLDDLRLDLDRARTMKNERLALERLWERLGEIRFLDPACGCGNFIIVAYRELRDLELSIMERLQDLSGKTPLGFDPTYALRVTLDHFYGIEIDEWPARIAQTAMFLIDRQCDLKLKERFGEAPQRLPIQVQSMILEGESALGTDWAELVSPSDSVVIAGNPPFLGHKERSPEQGQELRAAWGGRPIGHLDYVTGWYAKASSFLSGTKGRWAFVSTNSIVQGETVPTLFGALRDAGWRISFAHRSFQWSSDAPGQAGVQCVIIGFARQASSPRLFAYESPKGSPVEHSARNINAYLVDGPDVLVSPRQTPLGADLPQISAGSTPIDWNYLCVEEADLEAVRADRIAAKYLRRYAGGRELIHGLERWCLWMDVPDFDEVDVRRSPELSRRVAAVRDKRLASNRGATKALAATPHLFGERRQPSGPYLGIPQTFSENRPFATAARLDENTIASVKLFTAPDPDGFLFSIVSSSMFLTWQKTVGGRLESRPSFSSTVVWHTLPLPRLSGSAHEEICSAGAAVLEARALYPDRTLAELYKPEDLPAELASAHDELDELVDKAFGARRICSNEEGRQELLFERYRQLSSEGALPGVGNTRRPPRTR